MSIRKKEQQRQSVMNRLQPPFPIPLRCWRGKDVEKLGVKLSLRRMQGQGKDAFRFTVISYCLTLFPWQ